MTEPPEDVKSFIPGTYDRNEVNDGMLDTLARVAASKLNTNVKVTRTAKGKGWEYNIVFKDFTHLAHLINFRKLTVGECKRILSFLCDAVTAGLIGPGPR